MSGIEDRQALLDAGFSPEEVLNWEANQRKSLMQAGFGQDDIDKHFGTAPYDTSKISDYFHSTWKKVFGDEHSPTFKQAMDAGLQSSVIGLAVRGKMPDAELPEDAPVAQRFVSGAAGLAADFPVMVAGGIIGGAGGAGAGGAAGTAAAPGPGTAVGAVGGAGVGALAGSFALPAALRAIQIDAYTKGDIDSFSRFWEALSTTMTEGFKGYVVGAATGGAGAGVKMVAGSRAAAGLEGAAAVEASALAASKAAPLATAAELGTMVTVGKALEGEMPEPRDFLDAALLLGAGKLATATAAKLQRLYVKTGVRPVDVIEDAKNDPTIKQDILSSNVEVPKAYEARVEEVPGEAPKGLPAPEAKAVEGEVLEPSKAPVSRDATGELATDKAAEVPSTEAGKGGGGEPPKYTDAKFSDAPKELPGPKSEAEITDPWEKVRSRIDVGNHDPKESMTLDRLYSMFIDDMHALPGKEKDAAESPYKLFRLTRGSQGRADHFLEYGTFDAKTYANNGEGLKSILRPVEAIEGGLDRFRTYAVARRTVELDANATERATQLNAAKGEANRARENADALQTELDARKGELNKKQFRSMQDAITAWKDKAAEHDKAAAELEKKQMKDDPTGVDLEAANEVVRQGREQYEPVMRKLVDFQNRVSAYLRDSGVLSKEAYEAMTKANEQYIPFYRLLEPDVGSRFGTDRGLGARNPIHRIKGSDLKIVDPLESVIKNTYTYIALADRNEAGVKLIDLLTNKREVSLLPMEKAEAPGKATGTDVSTVSRDTKAGEEAPKQIEGGPAKLEGKTGDGEIVRVEEPTDKALDTNIRQALEEAGVKDVPEDLIAVLRTNTVGGGKIAVFMDGKRTVWKVDKDIEAAFKAVDQETANLIIRMMAVPARMLRAGATVTPEFIGRNAVRDFVTAFINSKGIFTPLDTLSGLMHVVKKDDVYQAWLKSGGANSAMVSLDRRYLQENLFKLHEETNFTGSAWNVVKTPFAMLRVMSELIENATRVGEFSKIVEGNPEAAKANLLDAGYASREVTLDFARMGSKMRALNMIAAFTNAQVQGVDRAIREVKARPVSFTLKAIAGITLPSVALWIANKDDERWESIPRWEKDMFWIVMTKDHIYRIPKPFEIGVLFGSLPERALEAFAKDNPNAMKDFGKSVWGALTPNIVSTWTPTAITPFLEAATNRSFFQDAPIVPAYLEKELPEYRYQPYTTEIAKKMGHVLGSIPPLKHSEAISPIMLENFVRDWTGGLGMQVLQMADKNLKMAGILPDPVRPADTLSDIPFIRAFVVRYPSGNAQEIRDFYDRHKEVSQVMATVKDLAQHGDFAAVEREMKLAPDAVMKLDGIASAIGMQSKFIREVYKMPDLTPDDKRQLIDTAYFQMIAIAKQGNAMAEQAKKILNGE